MNEILTIPALSLWQPHAQAIALGIKPYETRSWPTKYRGPLAIHAAKKPFRYQDYPIEWYQEACIRLQRAGCPHYALHYGCLLCVVDVVDCVPTKSLPSMQPGFLCRNPGPRFWGDFTPGRWAFRLENVLRLKAEIPMHGRQRFFNVTIPAAFREVPA